MPKFWPSGKLNEAVMDLEGSHFTEHEPLVSGGQKRWPSIIRTATIHSTPSGDVKMHYVDCYGWRIAI